MYSMQGRRVLFRGKVCRVHSYLGSNRWDILDHTDTRRYAHTDQLIFLK